MGSGVLSGDVQPKSRAITLDAGELCVWAMYRLDHAPWTAVIF